MSRQRGGLGTGLAVFIVVVILAVAGCLAIADDDDDENGWVPTSHQDDDDRSRGKNSRGDCDQSDQCSDNDFSPNLEDSPVIICLPSSSCDFGDGEQASLMPPDPEQLIGAIRVFTQGVGEAAGALAGAIAGGTIGILL